MIILAMWLLIACGYDHQCIEITVKSEQACRELPLGNIRDRYCVEITNEHAAPR